MNTTVNNNNIESKNNQLFNAIVDAIKSDRMIGRHIAESYGLNGPRPVYGIEVWESIVYVHTDTDRRIFDKAIDRLLKAHTDLFKWADFQKVAEDGPHIVLALTEQAVEWKKIVETPESLREYISKIKAEAMARVPYKKGDRIKDNQGQEGTVLDVSPNIWWNNYGVPYIMSQWGMVTNPKHFDPNDPNDQPDVDARVELDNGKIWAGGYHLYHPVATLEESCEITDIPAADLVWDEDEQGVKVWGNIDKHAENLTKMGAKRGRVMFTSNKTGLPTGADCWVLPKCKGEDVRQYVRKVHERISRDFGEAREKYGDKGHKYHEGEKVVTIYGRGTVVRGRAWYASDLIDVQLDAPTYNYIWSLLGTPQKMVAVSRNDIVSIQLPEPPAEIVIDEEPTLESASEISDNLKSRKRTIVSRAKEGKQAWRMYNGYEVRVRKAYTNGSKEPENWTYCVSWYAGGQVVECENGVRLEQAAKALNDLPQWAEARKAA